MKLLVITHDYPPVHSPRATRWGLVVEELTRAGHSVHVVCGWVPGQPLFQASAGGLLRIQRVGGGWFDRLRHGMGGGSPLDASDAARSGRAPHDRLKTPLAAVRSRLAAMGRAAWRSVYWPDAWCSFILPAWKAVRTTVAAAAPDALITVSFPFSSHLPGLWLKRRHPGLRWLADIGDPFAGSGFANNEWLYGRLNHRMEAAVLAAADGISVTNRGARDHYVTRFGTAREKVHVIAPIMSSRPGIPPRGTETREDARHASRPIRLVYCGQLYRRIRNPQPLLNLLNQLAHEAGRRRPVELHLYGGVGDCADAFRSCEALLGRNLFVHGRVSREQALSAMQESDVLVNIGNATPHQVPSKVIEYLGTGKPILNLITSADDQSRDYLEGHPAALTIDVNAEPVERQLDHVRPFLEHAPRQLAEREYAALVGPFLPRAIASAYAAAIADHREAA